jgi:DNA-binding transcriptional LysR family regulator
VHYHPESGMAAWVDQLADRHGVTFNPALRTHSSRTAAQLAAAGIGAAIVPISALAAQQPGLVRRLQPTVACDIVALVDTPSDPLVHQFLTDIGRRGLPTWNVDTYHQ